MTPSAPFGPKGKATFKLATKSSRLDTATSVTAHTATGPSSAVGDQSTSRTIPSLSRSGTAALGTGMASSTTGRFFTIFTKGSVAEVSSAEYFPSNHKYFFFWTTQ